MGWENCERFVEAYYSVLQRNSPRLTRITVLYYLYLNPQMTEKENRFILYVFGKHSFFQHQDTGFLVTLNLGHLYYLTSNNQKIIQSCYCIQLIKRLWYISSHGPGAGTKSVERRLRVQSQCNDLVVMRSITFDSSGKESGRGLKRPQKTPEATMAPPTVGKSQLGLVHCPHFTRIRGTVSTYCLPTHLQLMRLGAPRASRPLQNTETDSLTLPSISVTFSIGKPFIILILFLFYFYIQYLAVSSSFSPFSSLNMSLYLLMVDYAS